MFIRPRHRRYSAGSSIAGTLLAIPLIAIRGCMFGPDRPPVIETAEMREAAAKPVAPHMGGAFYPEEHPEMFAHTPSASSSTATIGTIATAGIGGLMVACFAGSAAFLLLGMVTEEPEIALDVESDGYEL